MSRRTQHRVVEHNLSKELNHLKEVAAREAVGVPTSVEIKTDEFDLLTPTEQSAASLGVHPESWKPIGFLNSAHFAQLVKANALDDDLARRIEAHRVVSAGGS